MRIYVDFDDCLCETARAFSKLALEMFDKKIPYEEIHFFDLKKSFGLTDKQYEQMMIQGHRPDALLSYEEVSGASQVIGAWVKKGYNVSVITGRPFSSYEPSRAWLDNHGLDMVKLYCLNKYGRDSLSKTASLVLKLRNIKK